MVHYTTAQLDAIVAQLEAGLGQGLVLLRKPDGSEIQYRGVTDIRNAIAYFQALYNDATDASLPATPKVRTVLAFGGKGFSQVR